MLSADELAVTIRRASCAFSRTSWWASRPPFCRSVDGLLDLRRPVDGLLDPLRRPVDGLLKGLD